MMRSGCRRMDDSISIDIIESFELNNVNIESDWHDWILLMLLNDGMVWFVNGVIFWKELRSSIVRNLFKGFVCVISLYLFVLVWYTILVL